MSNFDEELDDFTMAALNLEEEDAKEFRQAVMNLVYEDLFKPLWRRHEEFKRRVAYLFLANFLMWILLFAAWVLT